MTNDDGPGFAGILIMESLRAGTELGQRLTVERISRLEPGNTTADQPRVWTLLDFRIAADQAPALAHALADALTDGPWYGDFRNDQEVYVIFAGRIFRYPRGDAAGRAEAVQYGRLAGVPESQLDWPV
jgi:hypothetical protein